MKCTFLVSSTFFHPLQWNTIWKLISWNWNGECFCTTSAKQTNLQNVGWEISIGYPLQYLSNVFLYETTCILEKLYEKANITHWHLIWWGEKSTKTKGQGTVCHSTCWRVGRKIRHRASWFQKAHTCASYIWRFLEIRRLDCEKFLRGLHIHNSNHRIKMIWKN